MDWKPGDCEHDGDGDDQLHHFPPLPLALLADAAAPSLNIITSSAHQRCLGSFFSHLIQQCIEHCRIQKHNEEEGQKVAKYEERELENIVITLFF